MEFLAYAITAITCSTANTEGNADDLLLAYQYDAGSHIAGMTYPGGEQELFFRCGPALRYFWNHYLLIHMHSKDIIFDGDIFISYGQFLVYDDKSLTGFHWTKSHFEQGFARQPSSVAFGTILEDGTAKLRATKSKFIDSHLFSRIVEIPFFVRTGLIIIKAPDEAKCRYLNLEKGNYKLTCSQSVLDEDSEVIALAFELLKDPLQHSKIIKMEKPMRDEHIILEDVDLVGRKSK